MLPLKTVGLMLFVTETVSVTMSPILLPDQFDAVAQLPLVFMVACADALSQMMRKSNRVRIVLNYY